MFYNVLATFGVAALCQHEEMCFTGLPIYFTKHLRFISQVVYEARLVEVRRVFVAKTIMFCMQSERRCGQLAARADKIDARLGC